jgi:hypothetical protein
MRRTTRRRPTTRTRPSGGNRRSAGQFAKEPLDFQLIREHQAHYPNITRLRNGEVPGRLPTLRCGKQRHQAATPANRGTPKRKKEADAHQRDLACRRVVVGRAEAHWKDFPHGSGDQTAVAATFRWGEMPSVSFSCRPVSIEEGETCPTRGSRPTARWESSQRK